MTVGTQVEMVTTVTGAEVRTPALVETEVAGATEVTGAATVVRTPAEVDELA